MEINFKSIQADQEVQAKSAARDQHNQAIWDAVLDRTLVADMDCNYRIVLDYCGGRVLQSEAIDNLLLRLKRNTPDTPTLVMTSREELAEQIVDDDQMTHTSAWDKRQFKLCLSTYSLTQLRNLIRKFRAQAAIQTAAQAREVLKEAGPKPPRFAGFPQMLPRIFLKETFTYVDSRRYCHEVMMKAQHAKGTEGSMAVYELKRLCRIYGTEQFNYYAQAGAQAAQAEELSNG
jgi:hypothetical protein